MPALEAAEFAAEHGRGFEFHRALFKSYFTGLSDISDADVIIAAAEAAGLDGADLRASLVEGRYRDQVRDGIEWSRSIGVTAIPTFVFDDKYGIVGAQDYTVLQSVMEQLGRSPKA